jgi:triacylglycerol esterase/lipase EstA (alpha/beta hydrolase family)
MPIFAIRSIVALLVVATLIVFAAPAAATPKEGAPGAVAYSPPVDAPVSDPFRPPSTPYGPGNRGIEYATAADTTVVAAADGTVRFAGVVAGRRWVTLSHDDAVRTTYGPLAEFSVSLGDRVRRGDPVGTSAGALLFTARVGEAYIDPASLFGSGPPRVYLVPEPIDPAMRPKDSRGGWSVPGGDALLSAIDWERRHLEAVPGFLLSLTPAPAVVSAMDALTDWQQEQERCTSASVNPPPPTGRRFAVLVAGLGSSSTSAAVADVDTATLGYGNGDVVRFSYAGGRVPSDHEIAAELDAIDVADYGPRDTVGDLELAGHRLVAVLLQVANAAPAGVPVDVIAHSQGGLVTRLALAELATSHPGALAHLGVVATLGTPHGGADLAGLVRAAAANPLDPLGFDAVQAVAGLPISPDDAAVQQMTPGSDLLTTVAATPPPPGVTFVSVAARGDLVVPSPRAHLDGATNVVVPVDGVGAHDQLPGSPAVTREIRLAIAGLGPSCESAADAVFDAVSGRLVSNLQHAVAVTQGA